MTPSSVPFFVQNDLTTGFLAYVYVAMLRPTDIGRRADDGSPALTRRLARRILVRP